MTELTWQRKIGEILKERNVVSSEQLEEALRIQEMILKPIGKILIDMEVTTEEQIAEALAEQRGFSRISLKEYKINKQAIKLFPLPMARLHKALLVDFEENNVVLAMADPLDVYAIDDVRMITGREVMPVVCTESEILEVIDEYLSGVVHPSEEDLIEVIKEKLEEITESNEGNIPALTDSIIRLAAEHGVNEVYFEPREQTSQVRFRINGDLQDMMVLKKEDHATVATHLTELLGNGNKKSSIALKRAIKTEDAELDIEALFLPSIFGSDMQIKILNTGFKIRTLEDCGLKGKALIDVKSAISNRSGLILGIKIPSNDELDNDITSLFYPVIQGLVSPQKRVIAVEAKVKEQLRGVVQVERSPDSGLALADDEVLSAILESPPEVLLAVDLKDESAIGLLLKAATRGTLVLTAIQADNAVKGLSQFAEMSGNPALLAETLKCVVAQKTVKKLCFYCRQKYQPKSEILDVLSEKAGFKLQLEGENTFYTAKGCEHCGNTGFLGTTALFEILPISDALAAVLLKRKDVGQIEKIAEKDGIISLKYDSYCKSLQGDISFEELIKQIG